jgi:hypothetical protein
MTCHSKLLAEANKVVIVSCECLNLCRLKLHDIIIAGLPKKAKHSIMK